MSQPSAPGQPRAQRSSTGLDPKLAGLLCYLAGFVSAIVFLVIEKEDREVRFHAFQSLATFGVLFALSLVAGAIPFIGWIVALLLTPLTLVLWIVLMVKAFQGERWKVPGVGDWAEDQAGLSE
jgi:uncharacterized membrane protein